VRVAEVSRDVIKQFGLNWDLVTTVGNFAFGVATGNPVLVAGAVLTRQGDADSLFVRRTTESLDLNVLIDALAGEGLISLLAEPNLTALSGETASFLAGGEFPIPVPQSLDRITDPGAPEP
jgi:pilus assembly protein CpaC